MKLRILDTFYVAALGLLLVACDSSGSSSSRVAGVAGGCPGAPAGSFCLSSCNLGCSGGTCGVSEIAVNQQLVMVFNRTVDPASVNPSTFSIKTSAGKRPTGSFTVDGNVVTFTPSVVVTASSTAFGFDRGETYLLHLPGQEVSGETIRSSNGFGLYESLLCTLTASKGVIDPNNSPPEAKLILPSALVGVAQDTLIVLEFSELLTMSTVTNPTAVDVNVSIGGGVPTLVQCERFAQADPVTQRVNLTLRPSILLPSRSRVDVRVKGDILDLAGKPCTPATFNFEVVDLGAQPLELKELFLDTTMLDPEASGGGWGAGKVAPAVLGGTGVLGTFSKDMFVGLEPVNNVLELSTDSVRVKADYTLTGQEIAVTNGVFEFENFVLPRGLILSFRGANVPKILVRGTMLVEGLIRVNGFDAPSHDGGSLSAGLGGRSNCGGGLGGNGSLRDAAGQNGAAVAFPAGSPRLNSAAAIAAGGKGSPKFPTGAITYNGYDGWVCAQVAAGGSGGSNATQGAKGFGELTGSYNPAFKTTDVPPDNLPGSIFPYLPRLPGVGSDLQFLAGGSGGGGGGSSPLGSMKGYTTDWHTGQGGGGGGGALLIRTGGDLGVGKDGVLEAAGGGSPDPMPYKRAIPGGGGSGGNILMQVGGRFLCQGKIWAPGGRGGSYAEIASYNWGSRSAGGVGGYGFLRVEAPVAPSVGELVGFVPGASADNTGALEDSDPTSGYRSKFYPTRRLMPLFTHYLIEAVENGQPVTYSDDSRLGKVPSFESTTRTPVVLFLQGAQVDSQGGAIGSTLTKWVTRASALNEIANWFGGKATARPTAARWILLFDKSRLSSPATVEVKKVTVFCEG